jgi:hypothetical protein
MVTLKTGIITGLIGLAVSRPSAIYNLSYGKDVAKQGLSCTPYLQ